MNEVSSLIIEIRNQHAHLRKLVSVINNISFGLFLPHHILFRIHSFPTTFCLLVRNFTRRLSRFDTFRSVSNPFFQVTMTEMDAITRTPLSAIKQYKMNPADTIPVNIARSTTRNNKPMERNTLSTLPIILFGTHSIRKEFLATLAPLFPMARKNMILK